MWLYLFSIATCNLAWIFDPHFESFPWLDFMALGKIVAIQFTFQELKLMV
jgi:hypothetical protein